MKQRHDFTNEQLRWGWNIIGAWPQSDGTIKILGVGRQLQNGDEILLSSKGEPVLCELSDVKYDDNPPDLFHARVRVLEPEYSKP